MAHDGVQGGIWDALAKPLAHCGSVWDPWGVIWGALARFGEPLEPMGVLWVALESHFGGVGAILQLKILNFVKKRKMYKYKKQLCCRANAHHIRNVGNDYQAKSMIPFWEAARPSH